MSKVKMQAAKELIQEKRYTEARTMLKGVDHPTARAWLEKLDQIAPIPRRRKYTPARTAILILAVITTLVAGYMVWGEANLRQRVKAQEPQARAYLDLMCTLGTNLGDVRCEQYVHQTVTQNWRKIPDIVFCADLYSPVSMIENFASCLIRRDIPLPI